MEINEENCKCFGNGSKVMKLWIITHNFSSRNKCKQTKQSINLNCFMQKKLLSQKKIIITITIITITIINEIKRNDKKKEIKKLIKIIMEAIMLKISWHY